MFDGFTEFDLSTAEGSIHGRRGGGGPPVLLLHGIPETHLMWHRVAPRLAEHFTVVATDLRGFGASTSPPATSDHAPHSMRAIAREQVEVMSLLGFDHFAVVALGFWLWRFLAAPAPIPEQLFAAAPELLVNHMLDTWSDDPQVFTDELRDAYLAPFRDPATIAAVCKEYRAAATLDVEHDDQDRPRRPITCPVLALWSASGATAPWYDPLVIWRTWAADVTGTALDCGHFLPEEAPDETNRHLLGFLS